MTTANGIDVSSWQHPSGAAIDWAKVKAAGADFAIVKATQGVQYVNPYFDGAEGHDVTDAEAAGVLTGAYHFAQPGSNTAEAEAEAFIATIGAHILPMGLWLDLEDLGTLQPHEAGPWAAAFLTAIASHNVVTGLYTNKSLWSQVAGAVPGVRLWLANPTPEPGDPAAFITQYGSGPVDGIVGAVDLDRLENSRPVNPGPTQPPPAPPIIVPPAPPVNEPAPSAPQPPQEADVQVPTLSEQTPGPGTVSEATRAVQALLLGKAGISVGPTGADGRYGNQTALGVRAYQERHGLTVDGVTGPVTWEHLCTQ